MKWVSAAQAAQAVQGRGPVPRIVVSGNHATPHAMVAALDAEVAEFTLWALNAQSGMPDRDGITLETCFVGPGMRRSARLRYVPARLSLVPVLFRERLRPDVVVVHTSRVVDGKVSLGAEVNVLPSAIEQCRAAGGLLIAQVNQHMPYTFGDGEYAVDDFDYLVEADVPLVDLRPPVIDEVSASIGERVADRVPDGATLQLGIGAVPDATLPGVVNRRGLKIWSEMVSDGVLTLLAEGALDPDEPVVASFVFGSQQLYDWVDQNPAVQLLRTETTNNPAHISARPQMVSVNAALQVDLFGQANASRIGSRIYSGFGGQTDFVVGALHSPGGQALIAMRSWHPKADVSTIVPLVDEPVTSFQHSAVVTENGVASIWGYSQEEQALNLIDHAAHPDVRDELYEEAVEMSLVRPGSV
ncbi:MAG: acetyl-CoA hydrolase/transferase C-terminal domain-containing protein [Actinomycetes bacterium]